MKTQKNIFCLGTKSEIKTDFFFDFLKLFGEEVKKFDFFHQEKISTNAAAVPTPSSKYGRSLVWEVTKPLK